VRPPPRSDLNALVANNLNCGRKNTVNGERLEYLCPVSAGIGGEPLRQQRAPGVIL